MKLFRVFALWLFRDVFESFISKSVINYLDSCCIAEIFWWERIIMLTETGMQIREGQWIWHFRLLGYWFCICPGDDSASSWRQNVFEGKMSIQMQSLKTLPKVNFLGEYLIQSSFKTLLPIFALYHKGCSWYMFFKQNKPDCQKNLFAFILTYILVYYHRPFLPLVFIL